jgi:hypothetical protein
LALVAFLLPSAPLHAQADADATLDEGQVSQPTVKNPLEAQRLNAALAGLTERARMVDTWIVKAARDYRRAAQSRRDALERLAQASRDLDRVVVRPQDLTPDQIESLRSDAEDARLRYESDQSAALRQLDALARLVSERDALGVRIADLRSRIPDQREQLTGEWAVSWMPAGVTGRFYLEQQGTLISGQYDLGNLGSGSLQGTFVGGKLFLQRIDARRGRDAEIEGVLDAGGAKLRGTWQSYELVQGGIPQGQWVARRVDE